MNEIKCFLFRILAVCTIFFTSQALAAYSVSVVLPEKTKLKVYFKAFDVITSDRIATLSSEVSGHVVKEYLKAELGSYVKSTNSLFLIDPLPYQAAVARTKVALEQARLDLALEKGKQITALAELKFISKQKELSLTKSATEILSSRYVEIDAQQLNKDLILRKPYLALARAKLDQAKKDHALEKDKLAKTIARAPCNGFVVKKLSSQGSFVSVGTALAEVVCDNNYQMIVSVPNGYYRWLQKRYLQQMQVSLLRRFGARKMKMPVSIVRVVPALKADTRMLQVYLRIKAPRNQELPVLLNEFAVVEFKLNSDQEILRIPLQALRGINSLWVADTDNKLAIEAVDILYQDDKFAYIPASFGNKRVITSAVANPVAGLELSIKQ